LRIRRSVLATALLSSLLAPEHLFSQVPMSQVKTITKIVGVVLDEGQKPVPNVTVTVKGDAKTSTITNTKGEFIITPNSENATLIFKSVGFKTQEVAITAKTKLPLGV